MSRVRTSVLAALALALAMSAAPAGAAITQFDAFGNMQYTQTANDTQPSGSPVNFFASRLFFNTSGDITAANGISGTGPAFAYTNQPGSFALFETGAITPSALDAYLAPGNPLTFSVTGGNLAGETGMSPTFGTPLFTSDVPYLTGNSYNQLQGLNAATAGAITFNGFTPVAGANQSVIFLNITRASDGASVFSMGFLPSSTTSVTVPADTLAAGTAYQIDLDYSSRLNGTGTANGASTSFVAGYDVRTEIRFTTAAVPEPSSLALTAIGAASAGLAFARRRGRAT